MDLKERIKILRRRRTIVLVTVSLITAVSALVALSLPPRYVTVASVLIEQRRSNVIDREATGEAVVQESTDSSTLAAEINLLRSRTYAQKVVEDLNLLSHPSFNPSLQDDGGPLTILVQRVSALSSWVPESWLVATGLAEQNPAGGEGVAEEPARTVFGAGSQSAPLPSPDTDAYENLMQRAVSKLLAGLRIKAGGFNLILIEVTSSDPRQAAQIADKVAELYVEDQLENKRAAVDGALDWLKQRVTELRERVLKSEGAVVAFREEHGFTSLDARRQEGGPGRALSDARARRAEKEELLRRPVGSGAEIFNVGCNKENYAIGQVGEIVKKYVPAAELISRDIGEDRRDYRVNFSKIEMMVGFKPQWTVEEGVWQVVDAIRAGQVVDYTEIRHSNEKFLNEVRGVALAPPEPKWAHNLIRQVDFGKLL